MRAVALVLAIVVAAIVATLMLAWLLSEVFIRVRHRRKVTHVASPHGLVPTPTRAELQKARDMFPVTKGGNDASQQIDH